MQEPAHDGWWPSAMPTSGLVVFGAASPQIEENETWGNESAGITIIVEAWIDPHVRANRVHDGRSAGIHVGGGSPRIEDNDVWGNAGGGVVIRWAGTRPVITGNRIYENDGDGIDVGEGASPVISGNVIRENRRMPIRGR